MADAWLAQMSGRYQRSLSARRIPAVILTAILIACGAPLFGAAANAQPLARHFLISVGETTIADGLRAIQRSTGAKVVFSPQQLRAVRTKGVNGQFTIEEALKLLLDGSGFEAQQTGAGTYVIVDPRAASLLPYSSRTRLT